MWTIFIAFSPIFFTQTHIVFDLGLIKSWKQLKVKQIQDLFTQVIRKIIEWNKFGTKNLDATSIIDHWGSSNLNWIVVNPIDLFLKLNI